MKKLFTLLAGAAMSVSGFAAVQGGSGLEVGKVVANPSALTLVRAKAATAMMDVSYNDADYTRQWTDNKGNVWDLQLKMYNETMIEFMGLSNADGTAISFDQLPYYSALYMLRKIDEEQNKVIDGVLYYLCWPTNYLYSQVFTWDGEWDEEVGIPVEQRDYTPVTPSVLVNDPQFCRLFQERPAGYVGGVLNEAGSEWAYWGAINNEWIEQSALYNSQTAYTVVDDTKASTMSMRSFDLSENLLEVKNQIYLTSNNRSYQINNTYSGPADVEGFEARYVVTPDFGDIHVFNAGAISSESLGLNNTFTEDFEPVTALYVATADPVYVWNVDSAAKAFNRDAITLKLASADARPSINQANLMIGYAFADVKYAEDTTLDPKEMVFNLEEGEMAIMTMPSGNKVPYLSIYPEPNVFMTCGRGGEWSDEWGMEVDNEASLQVLSGENVFGWGTTEGFEANLVSEYSRYITSKSTSKVIYHYDPTDMQKTREFSSIGTLPSVSAVEEVKAVENAAKVVARNGVISVNAAEKAPIAVYTLEGKLVKAANAETLNVEAAKGVYVVRVGNQAKKVVL